MPKGFDQKCYELAEHFLQDREKVPVLLIEELAQEIQDAIELWFSGKDWVP